MPKWSLRDQNNLRARRNESSYREAEAHYTASDRYYHAEVDSARLADARRPGAEGPDDPGTLHQFRDPNIGTPDWYADKGLQPPEPWIERWELDPNAEGFTSVVVDSETNEEVDGSREQLVVDTVGRSIGSESRVGTVTDTG